MEKPKKQILYKPSRVPNEPDKPSLNNEPSNRREKLAQWIKDASLINRTALCKESGVDRANLDKYLLKGTIPEQHIEALSKILKNYGYAG